MQYRGSYFIPAGLSAPTTFHKRLVSRNWKTWLAETYHRGWNDTGNRLLTAKTRYRRLGGKKRAAGGKSVGDVKLGNHATYQGPYLQLVQDDSLNISETLTFPSANISFVSSIYHYFSQHGTVSEMCLIKKFFLQI